LLLARHASAGKRNEWHGDDLARPLDDRGARQAEALVPLLAGYRIERILSSPARRCVETVEPLARSRGLQVEMCPELAESRQETDGADLVRTLAGGDVIACGHGGLEHAALADPPQWKKGDVFVLDETLAVRSTLSP
jgi:8-oxo-(d)GTP phosphatase